MRIAAVFIPLVFFAACANMQPVQLQPQPGQAVLGAQENGAKEPWLVSQKTHRVELASALSAQPVHQPLRLKLRVRNGGKLPVQFGPMHVQAYLNGGPVTVLSQEVLLQAAQDRLDNAQRSQGFAVGNARVMPSVQGGLGAGSGGSGVSVFAGVAVGGQRANAEVENAKAQLQQQRQLGLSLRQVNAGEWTQGEITLDAALNSWQAGATLRVDVEFGGEKHTLNLLYGKPGKG